jgi:hypothetical protein
MSSSDSTSTNPAPTPGPQGTPRTSAVSVVVCLILLAALVWAMAPARARFEPAPLQKVALGCAQAAHEFVGTDLTEVPGIDLSSLSVAQRNRVLYRLNMEPCPCGCNQSIAACRMNHPACPVCKDLVQKIVAEEREAGTAEPETQSH